jgi:hypothetical protein
LPMSGVRRLAKRRQRKMQIPKQYLPLLCHAAFLSPLTGIPFRHDNKALYFVQSLTQTKSPLTEADHRRISIIYCATAIHNSDAARVRRRASSIWAAPHTPRIPSKALHAPAGAEPDIGTKKSTKNYTLFLYGT